MKMSEVREAKYQEDLKSELAQEKRIARISDKIRFLLWDIEQEKERITDCLDQGYWSFAKAAITRIEEKQDKINHYKGQLSQTAVEQIKELYTTFQY